MQYDSDKTNACVHGSRPDWTVCDFHPSVRGLHYCDTREIETVLINTMANRREKYSNRAYKQAALARKIQDTIARPSTRDFLKIVNGSMMQNRPFIWADVAAAEDIFGPKLGSLKENSVCHQSNHVLSLVANVPYHIIKIYKDVVLSFDLIFVRKIALLVTVSCYHRIGKTKRLASRQVDIVGKALTRVIAFDRQRDFRVKECLGDCEFEPLRADLADAGAHLNITSKDEHVPEVARYIRTLKERARAAYNTVPFKKMPG